MLSIMLSTSRFDITHHQRAMIKFSQTDPSLQCSETGELQKKIWPNKNQKWHSISTQSVSTHACMHGCMHICMYVCMYVLLWKGNFTYRYIVRHYVFHLLQIVDYYCCKIRQWNKITLSFCSFHNPCNNGGHKWSVGYKPFFLGSWGGGDAISWPSS